MKRKSQGFSLVELVIVIVILGVLAATALPRYLNIVDDAMDASVDGVAGGVATAVSFVRAEWEVQGRLGNQVNLDGTLIQVDPRFGYPTGLANNSDGDVNTLSDNQCQQVFNHILQSAPRNVLFNQNAESVRYTAKVLEGAGGSVTTRSGELVNNVDLCVYHQVASLTLDPNTGVAQGDLDLTLGQGVVYNPASGQVISFTN